MTPEEIEKTIEFILRSRADAEVHAERFEEKMRKAHEKSEARLQAQHQKLIEEIDLIASAARDLVKVTRQNVASIRRHEEFIRRLDKNHEILMRLLRSQSGRIGPARTRRNPAWSLVVGQRQVHCQRCNHKHCQSHGNNDSPLRKRQGRQVR